MTLLQKLNKELDKVGLEFKTTKELRDKFRGILIDKQTKSQMNHEVVKILQYDKTSAYANWCRDYMNMYIKLYGGKKNENN